MRPPSKYGGRGVGKGPSSKRRRGGRSATVRVYALTRHNAQASNMVVIGILSNDSILAYVLFDLGATHSFISTYLASRLT